MKKILYFLLALALLSASACKKDTVTIPPKAFEDITFEDIKALLPQFTFQQIEVVNPQGELVLKSGSILFFITAPGNLIKVRVLNLAPDNTLTLDIVTYNSGGTLIQNKTGVTISGTFLIDFDSAVQTVDFSKADVKWQIIDPEENLVPFPETYMYLYVKK